jgi:murein DD-endopeptidase MepM/ murein hydrolase activator NlpD
MSWGSPKDKSHFNNSLSLVPFIGYLQKHSTLEQPKKKKLIRRLKSHYRLSVHNESTYEERFSALLTPWNVILFLLAVFIVSGVIVYSVVALTPLKQYLVPEFTDYEYRKDARDSRVMVDSLLYEIEIKDQYINDLKTILSGGVVEAGQADTSGVVETELPDYALSEADSSLREKISQDDPYGIRMGEDVDPTLSNLLLFTPLNGTVSSGFDPSIDHLGVDIVAPKNEVVKAVLDGTVIMASFTSDGGHTVQIQHRHNIISVYKHNSSLFKKAGEVVKAGDAIAVIGDSGDHSDGPHLHFELWLNGEAVDPLEYLVLGE